MASELRVTTIANNAGSESVDTTYVVNGSAKAWATLTNAHLASPSLAGSFNTASFTDNGSGNFYINWTSSFDSADYATTNSSRHGSQDVGAYYTNQSASRAGLLGRNYNNNSNTDFNSNMVASFGDLA